MKSPYLAWNEKAGMSLTVLWENNVIPTGTGTHVYKYLPSPSNISYRIAHFIMGYFEDAEYSLATGKPSTNPSPSANEIRRQAGDASYIPPKDLSATYLPKKGNLWHKVPTLHRQEATLQEKDCHKEEDPKCIQSQKEGHNDRV